MTAMLRLYYNEIRTKDTIAAGNRQPNFELGILNFDLFSASPTILNYSSLASYVCISCL